MPNYDIFDEYRYFEPNRSFEIVRFQSKKIAITICEDIWNLGNENPMYTICPLDEIIDQKPDFILNLSASPFSYEHAKDRLNVLRANVLKYKIPLFYVNCVGAQTDILFDGVLLFYPVTACVMKNYLSSLKANAILNWKRY